jgi:hypothetical protein
VRRRTLILARWLTLVLACWVTLPARADLHVFTDPQGRTLRAEIQSVAEPDVFLKRADGQIFDVKISVFSKADQEYIRQWAVQSATQDKGGVFEVTVAQAKTVASVKNTGASSEYDWQAWYKVTLHNQSTITLQHLRVEYQVFKMAALTDAPQTKTGSLLRIIGTGEVPEIEPDAEVEFETDKVPMTGSQLNSGWVYSDGGSRMMMDNLQGIWLRVYDLNGNLLQEWCSSVDIKKRQEWDGSAVKAPDKSAPDGGDSTNSFDSGTN